MLTQSGTTFTSQTITTQGPVSGYALDARGNLINATRDLKLSTYASGVWTSETITTGTGTDNDVVVDAFGVIRVAWLDTAGVHLATKIGTTWAVEQVSTAQGFQVKLAVGPTGKAAIGLLTGTVSTFVGVVTIFD